MRSETWIGAVLALVLLAPTVSWARGTYLEPERFLADVFDGAPPPPRVLFLRGTVKQTVREILGHRYPRLRVRYWLRGPRSAWILDEIGKERPITVGIGIEGGRVERVRVLVFRESRGDEVRHRFFTAQFDGAGLDTAQRLDRHIDNIAGATLSVRAVKKLVRLALYLDRAVRREDG